MFTVSFLAKPEVKTEDSQPGPSTKPDKTEATPSPKPASRFQKFLNLFSFSKKKETTPTPEPEPEPPKEEVEKAEGVYECICINSLKCPHNTHVSSH